MESKILELEKKYWDGMSGMDYETVKNLTKFPCIVAGKKGAITVDEPEFKQMFDQGKSRSMKIKSISDTQLQTGTDHAMIGYIIEMDYDGKAMKCVCTSTWIKENDEWKCAMHTECDLEE